MEKQPHYPIDPMILERRSRRAMSQEPVTKQELMTLFEAARWAPSSFNHQPWRFLYAGKDSSHWDIFFSLLKQANQVWAKNAFFLVTIISRNRFARNEEKARCHSFDAGAAFQNLALQGVKNGLVVHPMEGFDHNLAKTILKIPDHYSVQIMVAIGKPGKIKDLPLQLQEKENVKDRMPLEKIVMEGVFLE